MARVAALGEVAKEKSETVKKQLLVKKQFLEEMNLQKWQKRGGVVGVVGKEVGGKRLEVAL